MQTLIFNISNVPVFEFEIDHDNKRAILKNEPHELGATILLTPEERTYHGIEKRLNFLTDKNLTLKEHIDLIKKGEFYADAQHNLNISVEPWTKHMVKAVPLVQTQVIHQQIIINHNFGNTNVNGLQHKGAIAIGNEAYFAKLDDLNPSINGKWEDSFDVQYSSLSETLSAIFARNIKNKHNFDCVDYQFGIFNIKGDVKSGTISKNFLKENESERVLALGRKTDPHTLITTDDYAENIMDVNTQARLDNLLKYFTEHNVPYEHAKEFLINQAAFDIMLGNTDRLGNPSNFIIAYNNKTETGRLVNFDFGRTLPMIWTQTTEDNYDMSWLDEDLNDYSNALSHNNDSILSSFSHNEALQFLKDNGFEPFEIDIDNFKKDLKELNDKIQNSELPFKKFAEVKIKAFEESLKLDKFKDLCKPYSKTTSIDFSHNISFDKSQQETLQSKEKTEPLKSVDIPLPNKTTISHDYEFDL